MRRLLVGFVLFSVCMFLLDGASLAYAGTSDLQDSEVTITGVLTVLWGDQSTGDHTPAIYRLHQANGQVIPLLSGPSEGELLAARGHTIQVTGQWTASRSSAAVLDPTTPVFQVRRIEQTLNSLADAGGEDALAGSHPWITLMCRFNDNPSIPRDRAYFQGMYANTPGRLDHYWREMSYQQANVTGSEAVGWLVLPKPRSGYNTNGDPKHFNLDLAADDCTAAANAAVDFSRFVGINLMFNDTLDGFAWGGQHWFNTPLDGKGYFYVTWEPPWGYADITVLKHEMGHGFGLPHSAYSDSVIYDNAWDVMSNAWEGCYTSPAFRDTVYGCMGQGTIAYYRDKLGWIPNNQKAVVSHGSVAILSLDWLGLPSTKHLRMIKIPVDGTRRFYTVEARGYNYASSLSPWPGYDQKFQPFLGGAGGQGAVIHVIDPSRANEAHVIDVDGNGNTADAGAYLLPGETYRNPDDKVTIRVLSKESTGLTVQVSNGAALDAPSSVTISGPSGGYIHTSYIFTATVLPLNLTSPVTYTWTATGQQTVVLRGESSNTATFSWESPGLQTVSVTAANALGETRQTYSFDVLAPVALQTFCPPDRKCVFVPLVQR